MNAEHILNALGDVKDGYIADAAAPIPRRRTMRWAGMMAAVLALCLALTVPAAAYTDTGYAILYALSPAAAQALKPVNESCEANGVRMTVDSAVIENNTAYIRINMTDLEGDLFDGTIDLYDSYSINRGFDAAGTCVKEGYDEDTHTATYLVLLAPMDGSDIEPGKVTFTVGEFCGHTEIWEQPIEGIDLTAVGEATKTVEREGWLSSTGGQQLEEQETAESGSWHFSTDPQAVSNRMFNCLIPSEPIEVCLGAAITGIGWIDGMLHIQVCRPDYLDTRTSGVVYLTDTPGQPMDYNTPPAYGEYARVSFYSEDQRDSYEEYIFDVTPDEAASLTLQGWFQLLSEPVEGPWQVTFKLQ